jgi:hypothetical protein
MASLVVAGDTSGSVTLAAPAISGSTTLTLPTTTGTLVVTSGAQTIEFADGTVSAPSITNSGDTNTGIFFPTADTIAFTEGGVESMRIDSSGNVGIGTASPARNLSVYGTNATIAVQNSTTGATSSDGMLIQQAGNDSYLWNLENSFFSFGTNNAEQARITSAGLLQFNSGYGSVATAYGCRAWVNFNGTGTVAIRASGNVSSITDNGTGDYTLNFTNNMPDSNYMATQSCGNNNWGVMGIPAAANSTSSLLLQSTSQYRVYSSAASGGTSNTDVAVMFVAVFR